MSQQTSAKFVAARSRRADHRDARTAQRIVWQAGSRHFSDAAAYCFTSWHRIAAAAEAAIDELRDAAS